MWPFRSKTVVHRITEAEKPKTDPTRDMMNAMEEWMKLGETFNYLGTECVVVGYCRVVPCGLSVVNIPTLRARYADKNGVIHDISFTFSEFLTLRRSC